MVKKISKSSQKNRFQKKDYIPKKPLKILEKEVLAKSWFLNLTKVKFLNLKTGKKGIWYYANVPSNKKVVVIVAKSKDNELLLVKQPRPPLNKYVISFPAGMIDIGETIENAGKRELKEETGYQCQLLKSISPFTTISAGLSNEVTSIIECEVDKEDVGKQELKGEEDITYFWMKPENVKQLKLDPNTILDDDVWHYASGYLEGMKHIENGKLKYPKIMRDFEIINLVRSHHKRPEDIEEGDLLKRIEQYPSYELTNLNIDDLIKKNIHKQWDIDKNRMQQIKEEIIQNNYEYPPIIYDPINKSVIDGIHRLNALIELGVKTVLVYIGTE